MHKRLYVANLPPSTTEAALREVFAQYGEVNSVFVAAHGVEGRLQRFGFVDMATDVGARAAMESLNGFRFEGRKLRVDEARPRSGADRRAFGRRG